MLEFIYFSWLIILAIAAAINLPLFILSPWFTVRQIRQIKQPVKQAQRTDEHSERNKYQAISVIVPFYNEALSLADTLTSLIAQTQKPTEIILVDDGSTDTYQISLFKQFTFQPCQSTKSKSVIRAFQAEIYGIAVRLLVTANQGKNKALDLGLASVKSPIALFVDGDTRLESPLGDQ